MERNAAVEHVDRSEDCLGEFRKRARLAPEAPALLADGREPLTYAGLARQMDAVAGRLTEAGLQRGDVVAVILPEGPEMVPILLGVLSAAICAPLNPALREGEIAECLEHLGASAVMTEAGLEARPARKEGEAADVALLLHTSATTGKPRIVSLTHANLIAMAGTAQRVLELTEADRFLSMMPLFHLQGLMSLLPQLRAGGSILCTGGFDAEQFPSWIRMYRPTWYSAGPALHGAILGLARSNQELLRGCPLRYVRSLGAALPRAVREGVEAALQVPVLEGYGMTETGLVASHGLRSTSRPAGSVGQLVGPEAAIMDQDGVLLPPEREGEIVVRGPSVMPAYWNNPEANARSFRDGWFLTGDLGRLDRDGFLYVTGRLKEMINRGGEKVLPLEVEEALAAHPAVAEVAAFGVPHPTLGEDVAAAVVLRAGATAAELRRFAATRLANVKVPRRIYFVEAIPKGATGKPKRLALAEEFWERVPFVAASTPDEEKLAEIWKRVLCLKEMGIDDDFFDLGGDSFAMALMLTEVEAEFDADRRRLDESAFLAEPTIAALARILADPGVVAAGAHRGEKSPVVALQPNGTRIPFFCFPGADENPYYFRSLARNLGAHQPFYVVRDPRPIAGRGVYTVEEAARRFVESMRSIQPRGPYILGGHCYGGIAAFEMARQLAAQGEEVGLLVLFEVAAPGYPKVLRNWKRYLSEAGRQLSAVLRGEDHVGFGEAAEHARLLGGLVRRRSAAAARRVLVRLRLRRLIKPHDQVNLANARAASGHAPRELRCRVVQFISADEHHSFAVLDDPRLAWREVVKGKFEVRNVPGTADALFIEPNVGVLAASLREVLESMNPGMKPETVTEPVSLVDQRP